MWILQRSIQWKQECVSPRAAFVLGGPLLPDHCFEMQDPKQVRNTKGKLVWQRQCSASAGGSGNYTKLLMCELGMEVEEIKNSMSDGEEWRKDY